MRLLPLEQVKEFIPKFNESAFLTGDKKAAPIKVKVKKLPSSADIIRCQKNVYSVGKPGYSVEHDDIDLFTTCGLTIENLDGIGSVDDLMQGDRRLETLILEIRYWLLNGAGGLTQGEDNT